MNKQIIERRKNKTYDGCGDNIYRKVIQLFSVYRVYLSTHLKKKKKKSFSV